MNEVISPGNFVARLPGGIYRDPGIDDYKAQFVAIDRILVEHGYELAVVENIVRAFGVRSTRDESREKIRVIFNEVLPSLRDQFSIEQLTS